MNHPARVLIVDDHPLVREGLIARISAHPDLEVCGEAADVDQALSLAGITRPALMIVDLALKGGNGLDLIKKLKARDVSPKILVVSAYEEVFFAERALRAGAQGYINKQELQGSIIDAIRTLLREGGRVYGMLLGPAERRFDIGNFDAYFRAFVEFAVADPRHGPALRAFVAELTREPR